MIYCSLLFFVQSFVIALLLGSHSTDTGSTLVEKGGPIILPSLFFSIRQEPVVFCPLQFIKKIRIHHSTIYLFKTTMKKMKSVVKKKALSSSSSLSKKKAKSMIMSAQPPNHSDDDATAVSNDTITSTSIHGIDRDSSEKETTRNYPALLSTAGRKNRKYPRQIAKHTYCDRSFTTAAQAAQSMPKRRRRGGVAVHFPVRLHQILTELERDGYAYVMGWQPHGRCFCIRQPKFLEEHLLAKYVNSLLFRYTCYG